MLVFSKNNSCTSPAIISSHPKRVRGIIVKYLLCVNLSKKYMYSKKLTNFFLAARTALVESKLLNYGASVWIGMSRKANQGSFQWTDNSLMEYTHWAAQKPGVPPGNSACVQVGTDGRWVDKDCSSTTQAYMCKIHKGVCNWLL